MLPLINGKSFLSCVESDLLVLLDNEDYRENEYIDYKLSFAFLEIEKGKEREKRRLYSKLTFAPLLMLTEDILFLVFRIIMDVPLQLKELIFQMMIRIDLN